MENIIEKLLSAKTFEEQLEITEAVFKEQSWYGFLKWEQFSIYDLIMFYECMEDDDTTIWKEETPEDEKEKGTAFIAEIRSHLVCIE